jgi:hypothetical protein
MENDEKYFLKNAGWLIPTKIAPAAPKEIKVYHTIEDLMKDAPYKYRWCSGEMCACIGCVNDFVLSNGFRKEQWELWVKNNPDTTPKETGFGFKTYTIEK